MHGQLKFERESAPSEGLRSRKKAKTREVIEDAALTLFAEQGYDTTTLEQIAERADISTATFFHYFRGKADVVLSGYAYQMAPLCQAILERPSLENDLTAVRNALLETWIANVDLERTARTVRAVASSAILQGMSHQIGLSWLAAISQALAGRQGRSVVPERCVLVAHVVLAVFADAIERWIASECRADLTTEIKKSFDFMTGVSVDWSRPDGAQPANG
ncbi:transcriptional regulator, TetR family [Sphingomonas sp. YR710]|nr:transcriptional regulator, TetR family [Sphingomonas sp. YR710]